MNLIQYLKQKFVRSLRSEHQEDEQTLTVEQFIELHPEWTDPEFIPASDDYQGLPPHEPRTGTTIDTNWRC